MFETFTEKLNKIVGIFLCASLVVCVLSVKTCAPNEQQPVLIKDIK